MADELRALEARISSEYEKAKAELGARSDEYFKQYEDRWKKEYEAFQQGKYTKQEFKAWELAQLGRGEHWNRLKDQMAEKLTHTKEIASDYINDTLPIAYTKASNEIASLAQKSAMDQGVAGINFELQDESTIRNLMMNNRNNISFKTVSVNPVRDYKWNAERIQSALLQGILQGDSIDKIADRFLIVMENNRKSAIRNARTAVTSARSAGKQDRYDDLAKQGCEITKIWVATEDERTREEHADADGQEVAHDAPFVVGGEELMFPCDSSGSPWNVYNCRCTMKTGKIKFHSILSEEARKEADIQIVDIDRLEAGNYGDPAYTNTNTDDLEEAERILKDEIGFVNIEGIEFVNDEMLMENVNQLADLEKRFDVIHSSINCSLKVIREDDSDASVCRNDDIPAVQYLNLNPWFWGLDRNTVIEKIADKIEKSEYMPADQSKYGLYIITHEYGHMLKKCACSRRIVSA